jgi:hypothetical protein
LPKRSRKIFGKVVSKQSGGDLPIAQKPESHRLAAAPFSSYMRRRKDDRDAFHRMF